jgi:serine/threonine-protein kinase HipA
MSGKGGARTSAFAYDETWLANPDRFGVSADLPLLSGYQPHKAASAHDSVFHGAIADTAPDAWGRRVIARDHAKRRKADPGLPALTELDYLLAVDDFSRVGALRLRNQDGTWCRTLPMGQRKTPPLIELEHVFQASRAVELGQETIEDLRYLQGRGTSLGGMRPKCTMVDEDGGLAIGKFPSVSDSRSVTRGEVLALKLAAKAGIDAAPARIVALSDVPVAVICRFDRNDDGGRIPYQSAASLLQASREEDRSYTEIADAIRAHGHAPTRDVRQLWRRLVFNLLITNVDDHLQNHGFLHVAHGQWRLAPAFRHQPVSRTRIGNRRPGCPSRMGRSPIVGMLLARAVLLLGLDECPSPAPSWPRCTLRWRTGGEVALSRGGGFAAGMSWMILRRPSSMSS